MIPRLNEDSLEKSTFTILSSDVLHLNRMFSQTVVIADLDLDIVTSSSDDALWIS